jgi:SNF2 family DNA or RNA helicase
MQILHGTWIPDATNNFTQGGGFYLWVETSEIQRKLPKGSSDRHPRYLFQSELAAFLADELGFNASSPKPAKLLETAISPQYFLLPTAKNQPLPSLELSRYLEAEVSEEFELHYWQIDCYQVTPIATIIKLLNDLHFMALHQLADIQLGADLLFWYHYTQSFKQVILNDHYIPALKYRDRSPSTKSTQRKSKKAQTNSSAYEIYPGWEIAGEPYEAGIQTYAEYMPLVCACGFAEAQAKPHCHEKESLLRHFSECLLTATVTYTPSTAAFDKKLAGSFLSACLSSDLVGVPWTAPSNLEKYQQWQVWRERIRRTQTAVPFYLYFQLQEPDRPEENWQIQFQVAAKTDPSLRLSLSDYWRSRSTRRKELKQQFGADFEQNLLLSLGYAARIYPNLWQGLETDQPVGIAVDLGTAFEFLKESAWVLENAGYKVIVPSWWTPKGRQRAKIRLKARGRSLSGGKDKSKSYFSLDTLIAYQYELSIGGEKVTEREWQTLVNAKTPLVQFRGQWMELDQDKMRQMLEFWKTQQQEHPEMSLLEFMKLSATDDEEVELDFDRDQTLAEMSSKLNDKSQLEPMPDPAQFQGTLREYQKRGISWLYYLETLGLNGCLADDMGLGKTVQVIARLVQERELGQQADQTKTKKTKTQTEVQTVQTVPPTLLIAPTSVVGNWEKEIAKFAPHLRVMLHHGSQRINDESTFQTTCQQHDVVITSFTLARKDAKLLSSVVWQRLVLDEAQNIKNPKAAQTKAILKLSANHRLALTGTPVENRLLDLWSIFNFLNPGYLGKEAQFRKNFEIPIQKDNNPTRSTTLKKLVEPFILRRVKTDQAIIKDLPDKVEQKLYCNLTKEQASLYEATVKDVEKQLQQAEGIQRKGLILATLTKLKQVCNHPRQFLQDDSEFTPERSHKLSRLTEMIEEVMAERESLLIFTQFTEIGDALEKYLRHTHHYNTYYIHGGTARSKREQMIAEFQDPETEPSVFILSLKAGGVGITLTKANHVFHFDRWWNPAVEDQATDRAFRIGQKKNVFVHKFVAIGTLEERIDQMIEDKKKLAGAIVGSDESWLTELDNDAFKQLIALNKSAILE